MRRALILGTLVWLTPLAVAAQPQSGPAAPKPGTGGGGPMIVERIHSGFVIAPDVKVTRLDRKVEPLVGAFGGWQIDQTFLVGAGGYWLPNDRHGDREMAYGGLVVQWLGNRSGRYRYGVKALVGGGEAANTQTFVIPVPAAIGRDGKIIMPATSYTARERVRRGFGLAEPELLGVIRLSRNVRLTGGVGYRFAGTTTHHGGFDRGFDGDFRLNGATGSVALQIGGGS